MFLTGFAVLGLEDLAVVEKQSFFRPTQCGKAVFGIARGDVFFTISPACTYGKVATEYIAFGTMPMVGSNGKQLCTMGCSFVFVPLSPVMPNDNGYGVVVFIPPCTANAKTPSTAGKKRCIARDFHAAAEGANRIVTAAVAFVLCGRGEQGWGDLWIL